MKERNDRDRAGQGERRRNQQKGEGERHQKDRNGTLESLSEYKDDPEEERSKRIARPFPVGDISFLDRQDGIVSPPYLIFSFRWWFSVYPLTVAATTTTTTNTTITTITTINHYHHPNHCQPCHWKVVYDYFLFVFI